MQNFSGDFVTSDDEHSQYQQQITCFMLHPQTQPHSHPWTDKPCDYTTLWTPEYQNAF